MAKHKRLNVMFPLGGLNRSASYRQQKPYTTPDCRNIRPYAPIEGRERGGSRPGLMQSHITDLGDEIRMLYPMQLALDDGFTTFSDTFSGLSMAEAWSQASWADDLPLILPEASGASISTAVDSAAAVLSALPVDTTEAYCVEALLAPWFGAWHGVYRLYLRLDDTTPDAETDGVVIELTQTGATGAYTASLTSLDDGVETEVDTASGTIGVTAGWLSAVVSANVVTVYWNGTLILSGTVDAHTGTRVGFGLECTTVGGLCLANVFRVQYYATVIQNTQRTMLVASAGGSLYKETFTGQFAQITSDLTLRDDVHLNCVQSGQKLYIADYGDIKADGTDGSTNGTSFDATGVADWTALGISAHDDVVVISSVTGTAVAGTYEIQSIASGAITLASNAGVGNCSYHIERGPKVYDPATDTISLMVATDGQVPTGCPLITRHCDRIVLAGAPPHVWYMARVSNELDWDYSQEDSQRAVAGTASEAGVPGAPIRAIAPHSDDYLFLGCLHEIWVMRGDPAFSGSLDALSRKVGILTDTSWTLGPVGEFVWLASDGVYVVGPGAESAPIELSQGKLPREFYNIDLSANVSLEYDTKFRGVHVFITQSAPNDRLHWWIDWDGKSFWPVTLDGDHEPTATCNVQSTVIEESGVLLGCRDGKFRRFNRFTTTDCGTEFSSYVVIGPLGISADGEHGVLVSLDATMAEGSGDVTCEVATANTFEGAVVADALDSVTLSAGLNLMHYVAGAGQACALTITGGDSAWAFENAILEVRSGGRRRTL